MKSFLVCTRCFRSKPSEATFLVISSGVSSKAMTTPGSPKSVAPRTMNSRPIMVFPHPAPPQRIVVRPFGRPPRLISSSPRIPEGLRSIPCIVESLLRRVPGIFPLPWWFLDKNKAQAPKGQHRYLRRKHDARPNRLHVQYGVSCTGDLRERPAWRASVALGGSFRAARQQQI